jgi:pre-mRNA-splicing factor 38A
MAWEKDEDVYTTLEPYLADSRKLKRRTREGWALTYMDQFIDDLLVKSRVCATTLPKINPRTFLEDEDRLEPRESALGEELEELDRSDEEEDGSGSDGEVEEVSQNGRTNGHSRHSSDARSRSEGEMSDGD